MWGKIWGLSPPPKPLMSAAYATDSLRPEVVLCWSLAAMLEADRKDCLSHSGWIWAMADKLTESDWFVWKVEANTAWKPLTHSSLLMRTATIWENLCRWWQVAQAVNGMLTSVLDKLTSSWWERCGYTRDLSEPECHQDGRTRRRGADAGHFLQLVE